MLLLFCINMLIAHLGLWRKINELNLFDPVTSNFKSDPGLVETSWISYSIFHSVLQPAIIISIAAENG
jgi:hypothetical protein